MRRIPISVPPPRAALLAITLVLSLPSLLPAADASGVVSGTVVDAQAKGALPGAPVQIEGTNLEGVSDRKGFFRIVGVPEGEHMLVVSYLGFESGRVPVRVATGTASVLEVQLRLKGYQENVIVQAPLLEGQAKALNQQQNAAGIVNVVSSDQIGAFPDPNAAEAVQRVPGISIERDQGEGRYVLVRGTEARLNSMTINGERIPSPEGDIRSVALDVIPADLLESIEIAKTLTPDMDADAIGGTVNLVTAQAPERPRLYISAGGGYNSISEGGIGRGSALFAQRFADKKVGIVLSGSYLRTDRGSHNFEAAYKDGSLADLDERHYTVNRERWGLNGALDVRTGDGGQLVVRGIYNDYSDHEYRRRVRERVGNSRLERELKDRLETQKIAALSLSGRNFLSPAWSLDYAASWAHAEENQPEGFYSVFRQSKVSFAPNVSAGSIDPDDIQANPLNEDVSKYTLNQQSTQIKFTEDRDYVGSVNLARAFVGDGLRGLLKVGAKYRDKAKSRNDTTTIFKPTGNVFLADYTDPAFSPETTIIDGRYPMGPFISPAQGRSLVSTWGAGAPDPSTDAADYDAGEKVAAGYALARLDLGDKLLLLPGVRVERTQVDYTANRILYDAKGNYVSTSPLSGSSSYTTVLPGLNLRLRPDAVSNLRAAVTRSLARPNYYDLAPYEVVLQQELSIERGNPDLRSTTSWNFDLMYERFLPSVGVFSVGGFHKRLTDYIYFFTAKEAVGSDTLETRQPRNGDAATLSGIEVALQDRLRFLPAPFDGLGFYGNYTFADSHAEFPGRVGDKASLPGQSRHLGNVALTYEKGGFSGRVALNFHGKYISEVGETAANDVYYDNHRQLDLAASQRVSGGLRLYVEVNNLTNEPLRYYEGVPDRPVQEEYYRWWGMVGLKWDF